MVKIIKEDLKLVSGGNRNKNRKSFTVRFNASAISLYNELVKETNFLKGLTVDEIKKASNDFFHLAFIAYFGLTDEKGRFVELKEYDTGAMLRLLEAIKYRC